MKHLKGMRDALVCCAKMQVSENLENVNTCELGEVIDMIKDLEEAMYYHCKRKEIMKEDIETPMHEHHEEHREDYNM